MAAQTEVRESQIEDALVALPELAQTLLRLDQRPRLIARQMILPSGRLDLLYATGTTLTLVELKAEEGRPEFVTQVQRYLQDLRDKQEKAELVQAPITPVLLCPSYRRKTLELSEREDVVSLVYSPAEVLDTFFRSLRPLAELVALKPVDLGLWNIHLIHRALYALDGATLESKDLAKRVGLSEKTVGNHVRLAEHLRLVDRQGTRVSLTPLGTEYVSARNPDMPPDHLTEEQTIVLRNFVVKDPFASAVVLGIYSMVESVFTLARNTYPVPTGVLQGYFRETTGKLSDWSERKTAYHGTKMYSNYAVELGLLARSGETLYLTPDGIRFILLLQLHKSLKMIDIIGLTHPSSAGEKEV